MTRLMPAIHPGEILREEFLEPLGITPYALAAALDVPRTRIERLAREETPVSTDTAFRLARYFGTTPEFWMNLQLAYELRTEAEAMREVVEKIKPLVAA
ncbi:HigA family addiction module antitoxin [Aureimonas pseudogalii]|uniref:HigA family addiction module antitoxin n=1 Tax=Aureimonas pseudogalii TaxID=1744844 RepID=UPI0016056EB2|nr:HigA family addiction module antitoxin [Aureimonas pseudogalii]